MSDLAIASRNQRMRRSPGESVVMIKRDSPILSMLLRCELQDLVLRFRSTVETTCPR
jgi:hypothetical protein